MENIDKAKLITPLLVSSAAAIAIITMSIRHYEFYRMLWTLFIVMVVFFILGDIIQYIYMRIKPRVIPEADDIEKLLAKVDASQLQLDENLLEKYMNDDGDDIPDDIPESVLREAQRFSVDESELFGNVQEDYQDETFMEEQNEDF